MLDLGETAPSQQPKVGAERAEQLYRLLLLLKAREDAVTTENEAGPIIGGQAANVVVAVRFERSGINGEVRLRHTVGAAPYELVWLFSRETVASVPFWFRVIVKGEAARGAEPLDIGLGPIPDEVHRGTPREAVAGLLAACQAGRFDLAAFYLDLGAIPPERQRVEGERLARRLMLTLQRTGWVDPEKLSDDPLGAPESGVPENEQLFGVVKAGHQPVELLLAHRFDAELGHVWTVSQETVARDRPAVRAPTATAGSATTPRSRCSRSASPTCSSGSGSASWSGCSLSWFVSRYLGRWVVRLLRRLARRTAMHWDDAVARGAGRAGRRSCSGPGSWCSWRRWLGLTPAGWVVARYICKLLALVGVGWFLVRLVDDGAPARARDREGRQQAGSASCRWRLASPRRSW